MGRYETPSPLSECFLEYDSVTLLLFAHPHGELMRVLSLVISALLMLLSSPPSKSLATDWYVKPDGTGDVPTIRAAIRWAVDGDRIILADGIFSGRDNRSIYVREEDFEIISESNDPTRCIIDCALGPSEPDDNFRPAFFFVRTNTKLEGFTVRHGFNDPGGAIFMDQSSPTIRNCVFRDNTSVQGGAIDCQASSPIIETCVFINNHSGTSGGAIVFIFQSSPTVTDCTFASNDTYSPNGGVIVCAYGPLLRIDSSIIAFNITGEPVQCWADSGVSIGCSDVFGNRGGDWVGCIAEAKHLNANFGADPLFCDPLQGNLTLQSNSPCAPPGITNCGLVGALPVGCRVLSVEEQSWGKIKAAYR
jgi:hypothetical protein